MHPRQTRCEDRLTAEKILLHFIQRNQHNEARLVKDLARWVFRSNDCPLDLKAMPLMSFNESVELARAWLESQNYRQAAESARNMVLAARQITNPPHTFNEERGMFVPIPQVC